MAKSRKPFIGVDLGGTSMRAAVVEHDGTVLAFAKRKTHPELGGPIGCVAPRWTSQVSMRARIVPGSSGPNTSVTAATTQDSVWSTDVR